MPTRSRKEEIKYRKIQKAGDLNIDCVFCKLQPTEKQYVSDTKSFLIVRNIFSYSDWDSQNVIDHLMIIPKKHTETLRDLTASEAVEFVDLIGTYESRGYGVWARPPQSQTKTVNHQHTHLIKAGQKKHRFIFYIHRPYFRIIR